MCKLYYYVQSTCYTASVAILTVICLERYVAIIHPMHTRRLHDIRLLVSVIVSVWITAALSGLHYLVIFDTRQIPTNDGNAVQFCVTVYHFNAHLYTIVNFVMSYAGPLVLMAILYARISFELWKSSSVSSCNSERAEYIALRSRRTAAAVAAANVQRSEVEAARASNERSAEAEQMQSLAAQRSRRRWHVFPVSTVAVTATAGDNAAVITGRRKVIRLLMAVVASFAVCMLPYHARVLWQTFAKPQTIDDWQLVIPPITFVVYYLNSSVNPLLYAFLSQRFRSSLADMWRGWRNPSTLVATPPAVTAPRTLRTCTPSVLATRCN